MGTQQILMIVLSVIVVGAAVGVGIQMFDTQSTNQGRNAITAELTQFAIQAQTWFRTPEVMGGGEGDFVVADLPRLMQFINAGNADTSIRTPAGVYVFTASTSLQITITATSSTNQRVGSIVGTVNLNGVEINTGDRGISIVYNPA